MPDTTMTPIIGLDLSLKTAQAAILDCDGELIEEVTVKTSGQGLKRFFDRQESSLVVMEAGGTTPHVERLAKKCGHQTLVANPRKVALIYDSGLKTDRVDAEKLARLARADPKLLHPVQPRSEETQRDRSLLVVRSCLMRQRTASINVVRGLLRGFGLRFQAGSAKSFVTKFEKKDVPVELRDMVSPLLEAIDFQTKKIEETTKKINELAQKYPVVDLLQTVPGVGPLIATALVLCIEDPDRFKNARRVAGFLGLRPRLYKSGEVVRLGRITKEGDGEMRRLLVQGAHVLLRCKQDSELQRWGRQLKERIGIKKAVVAVARKLAVLLLVMWRDGAVFEPFLSDRTAVTTA